MISTTLFHCLDDTIGSSLVLDRLNITINFRVWYLLSSFCLGKRFDL